MGTEGIGKVLLRRRMAPPPPSFPPETVVFAPFWKTERPRDLRKLIVYVNGKVSCVTGNRLMGLGLVCGVVQFCSG